MAKTLTSKCPICGKNFSFEIDESMITNAESFPVVFSTTHCNQALICYLDGNFVIRMVEIAHIPKKINENNQPSTSQVSNSQITKPLEISSLSVDQRTVLKCTINKERFLEYQFPNLVEKQIFHQILKHGDLSMEKLIEELQVLQKAMNIDITHSFLNPIIEKYVKAGLLKISKI